MAKKILISEGALHIKLKEMFELGITTYVKCFEAASSKYSFGANRFTEQYHRAHREWVEAKQLALDEAIQANDKKRLESKIMTKTEALIILSKIARGELRDAKPKVDDRKKAIDGLAKMDGWWAPINTNTTISTDGPIIIDWKGAHDAGKDDANESDKPNT